MVSVPVSISSQSRNGLAEHQLTSKHLLVSIFLSFV